MKAIIRNNKIISVIQDSLVEFIKNEEIVDFPYSLSESTKLCNFYITDDRQIRKIDIERNFSNEQELFKLKTIRNNKLSVTDWTQVIDNQLTPECKEAFRIYRQALRDIDFNNVVWPEKPNEERI